MSCDLSSVGVWYRLSAPITAQAAPEMAVPVIKAVRTRMRIAGCLNIMVLHYSPPAAAGGPITGLAVGGQG